MNFRFLSIRAAAVTTPSTLASTLGLSSKLGRLVILTAGSALLLAAGSVSDSSSSGTSALGAGATSYIAQGDSVLAPMSAADATAAQAALDATNPAHGEPADTDADRPASLSALVASIDDASAAVAKDRDMRCLATAVYFESRGEPLEGQLAVAQAIMNRVVSGRYADNACAVINQPGQFSYNRSASPRAGGAWETAKAIAMIAADGMWHAIAPKAMSFHANYVSPNWAGKTKVVRIGRHIFYR